MKKQRPTMSARELRELREAWELLQEEMAELIGVAQPTYAGYEQEPGAPSSRKIPGPVVKLLERITPEDIEEARTEPKKKARTE